MLDILRSIAIGSHLVAIFFTASTLGGLAAASAGECRQHGFASAPFIGASDLRAIEKAMVSLPAVRPKLISLLVGAILPRDVDLAPLPAAVRKVLPQYAGYQALRTGHTLLIVKPLSRRLSYILPLRGTLPRTCP